MELTENEETIKKEELCETKDVKFKKVKKRNLRKAVKEESSDEDDLEERHQLIDNLKEIQNLRKRPNGVNIVALALGTDINEEDTNKDVFNLHSGGMMNMEALKSGKVKTDDAYDTGIGTQFSVETNKRDEDEEMMKYIEEQLSKRKKNKDEGGHEDDDDDEAEFSNKNKYMSPEEAALQAVPKHLRESSAQRSEEMLSNQMLNGIPEIDLGIECKIKNIEATEEAKLSLLKKSLQKNEGPSQFVPSNMAVNFIQHNRFNVTERKRKPETSRPEKVLVKDKADKASDDFYFEKFKKQFRKQ